MVGRALVSEVDGWVWTWGEPLRGHNQFFAFQPKFAQCSFFVKIFLARSIMGGHTTTEGFQQPEVTPPQHSQLGCPPPPRVCGNQLGCPPGPVVA